METYFPRIEENTTYVFTDGGLAKTIIDKIYTYLTGRFPVASNEVMQ